MSCEITEKVLDTMNPHATQQLYGLICQQREVLLELKHFAEVQHQIVQQNELGRLVSLLAAKQKAIQRLQEIDRNLAPFQDQDPESRVWSSEEQRDECRRIAKECPRLLVEVMKLEQTAEETLTAQRKTISQQIEQSTTRSQAANAYLQASNPADSSNGWSVEE